MKVHVILGLLLITTFQTMAQYDPDALKILDAMSAKYKAIPAFAATFSQKLTNETAGIDENISGKIAVKGSKYKLEVAGQIIFNDGQDVWSYNKEAKEVTVSTFDPSEQEISLSNIWDLYKDGYKYILLAENDNGNNVVDLDPIDRTKSYFKIRMFISQNYELKSFTVFESNGNRYVYTLDTFKNEPTMKDSAFTFIPANYPGVEVIDFR